MLIATSLNKQIYAIRLSSGFQKPIISEQLFQKLRGNQFRNRWQENLKGKKLIYYSKEERAIKPLKL